MADAARGLDRGLSLVEIEEELWVSATLLPFINALRERARSSGFTFRIISAYRSAARQEQLLAAYEAGDPSIAYPPARHSYHELGLAIDIQSNGLRELGEYAESLGLRWGGRFGDPNHFDLGKPRRLQE